MRLSAVTLAQVPGTVARPDYDRVAQKAGIVHFGIGAFHRAHQAWYTDAAMRAGDRDWGIIGVSLRSAEVGQQMNPQDGLYSLSERGGDGIGVRIIGSVRHVLVAAQTPHDVVAALASPDTHIVSFTITEKGYCRAADGTLDLSIAGPSSVYAYLARGLRARQLAGLPGVTLLCCDNLANNGAQLERLMTQYLSAHAPELIDWFAAHCTCPSTMVDRIVPATAPDDRAALAAALGMTDEAAVMTEPFSQWVIEDRFACAHDGCGGRAVDVAGARLRDR